MANERSWIHLFRSAFLAGRGPARVIAIGAITLLLAVPILACQVPVFRYALERRNPDQYQVYVLHDQPLDTNELEAVKLLKHAALAQPGRPAAIDVQVVKASDAAASIDPRVGAWRESHQTNGAQLLAFYPPANGVGRYAPIWEAALDTEQVSQLLDSPLRRELVQRLARGDSAVWIFVPCGRKQDDEAALETLENQLVLDQEWLQLPSPEELEVKPDVLDNVKIPLKIQFSVLTLERDNPKERALLQSLLYSENDLTSFDEPLAFPVFGQGRVLYCLVGKGITPDTIREASTFMAGPCSCQVKEQNPGFDLLLQTNWSKNLGEVLISEPIPTPNTEALQPTLLTIPPGRK